MENDAELRVTIPVLDSFLHFPAISCTPRVAVVGNVDAGKSTLLGVLTHGELDNGRGTARMKLFRHKHEMETGRTSSVGNDILGFDSQGGQWSVGRLRLFFMVFGFLSLSNAPKLTTLFIVI